MAIRTRRSLFYRAMPYLIYVIAILSARLLVLYQMRIPAGILILAMAFALGIWYSYLERTILSFRALLSFFWNMGEGIAVFQLSNLQKDWNHTTWICFSLFFICFLLCYDLTWNWECNSVLGKKRKMERFQCRLEEGDLRKRLKLCIFAMTVLSTGFFAAEIVICGYIPLFAKETHAYNTFHVTGLHYFTVSAGFVHALSMIFLLQGTEKPKASEIVFLVITNLLALMVPILCVSKFYFIFAVALPAMIFLQMKRIPIWKLLLGLFLVGICFAAVAVVMTIRRNYEPGYLNGIFDMKDPTLPMWVQYPYIYVANNYDNFNCLTTAMASGTLHYAFGLKSLFPVIALSGLKFLRPELVNFPLATTSEELNTLTLIYDAFYDFGIAGVVVFGCVLGIACAILAQKTAERRNPIICLLYGQIAIYLMLSFFSAWFSLPTTWFWFVLTALMYWFTGHGQKKRYKSMQC